MSARAKRAAGDRKPHTSSPTDPAHPDIRIVIQVAELSADVRLTTSRVAAARLREQGPAAQAAQIRRQGRESVDHAVRDTFDRRTALAVEILIYFINKLIIRAVDVLHAK